jgi:hypothetical protein
MRKRRLVGAGIALVLALFPAGAGAADETYLSTIAKAAGNPLEAGIGENASLHANLDGSGDQDVFWFDEAGLTLAVFENGGVRTYGTIANEGDEMKVVSLPVASGSGTGADPWTITSTWDAGSPARFRVTQVMRFTNGSQRFATTWSVQNVSGAPLNFRAYLSAWVSASFCVPVARSDATAPGSVGVAVPLDGGVRDPNDPVFDGYDFGRATDLEPDPSTPWRHAVAGEGPDAALAISQGNPLPATLPARTRYRPLLAAEWDAYAPGKSALAPGASYTVGARLHHASALRTPPLRVGTLNTEPYTLHVYTDTADGGALANRRLGWIVDGYSRELSGTMTTDATGQAALTWTADGQQTDRVIVWIDTDADGVWDRDTETTRQSWITWVDSSGVAWGGVDTPGSGITGSDVTATGGGVTGVAVGAGEPPLPAGTSPATADRATLRIARLSLRRMTARVVRIAGVASAAPAKPLVITLRTRNGRLLARGRARVKERRFALRLRVRRPVRSSRQRITIRYPGDAHLAPFSLRRTIALAP